MNPKYLLKSANKILATDYSEEMLKVASSKLPKSKNLIFLQADAYNPPISFPKYNAAMANFWFSHIPRKKIIILRYSLKKYFQDTQKSWRLNI
ncbi:class I SAM-dependent methyltransferase [Candidatus Daviesbacteria bacterium]|nr:class I SAM-dependent methyltransferase [Candidatus Daviesbacteria bacterium]